MNSKLQKPSLFRGGRSKRPSSVHHRGDRRESRPFVVGEEGLPLGPHKQESDLAFRYQLSRLFGGSLFQYFSFSRRRENLRGKIMSEGGGSGSGSGSDIEE